MNIKIETKRLIQFSIDDVNSLHEISTQKYILDWMPDWQVSVETRIK